MIKTDPEKERLWEQIKPEIKTDGLYYEHNREALARAVRDMPELNPDKELWTSVQENIKEYPPFANTRKINTYLSGIAAVIVLGFATFLLYQVISQKQLHEKTEESGGKESVDSFLARVCSVNPAKCKEVGFIELKSEIFNLYTVKMEVANSIFANPDDKDIIKVNERIESQIELLKSQIIEYVE